MNNLQLLCLWVGFAGASIGSAISPPKSRAVSVTLAVIGVVLAGAGYFLGPR